MDFEIYEYPVTHTVVIDIYHYVYLHSVVDWSDKITCTRLSLNDKYAKWLMDHRDVLDTLYEAGKWYISDEHTNDAVEMKYYHEFKQAMDKHYSSFTSEKNQTAE